MYQLYITTVKEIVGPFRIEGNNIDDEDTCKALNKHFLCVLTRKDASKLTEPFHLSTGVQDERLYGVWVAEEEIIKGPEKLKKTKILF